MKPSIIREIKNIVNYKPIRSDAYGDYAAVVVENLDVKGELDPLNIRTQKHVVLVYNYKYQSDPFKVMTYDELGVKSPSDLESLSPCFFVGVGSSDVKLGINIGDDKASIRVFNLGSLQLILNKQSNQAQQLALRAIQVDSFSSKPSALNSIFEFPVNPEPTPEKKGNKKTLWIILGIVAALAVIGGSVGYYLYLKRHQTEAEDEYVVINNNKFDTENTIKTDRTNSETSSIQAKF